MKFFLIVILCSILFFNKFVFAKSIIDIQPNKLISTKEITSEKGKLTQFSLINLNADFNRWYILKYDQITEKKIDYFHFQNPDPDNQIIKLSNVKDFAIDISVNGKVYTCELTVDNLTNLSEKASKSLSAYEELCDNRIFLRIAINGRRSSKEAVASFLRKHIWGGEKITSIVKQTLFKDKFMLEVVGDHSSQTDKVGFPEKKGPQRAKIDEKSSGRLIPMQMLGIPISDENVKELKSGEWYPTKYDSSVYVSAIEPKSVADEILKSYPERTSSLDSVESKAIAFLVAFDLEKFGIGFMVGTEHPSAEWSTRVSSEVRDKDVGPDGFDSLLPIVGTGRLTKSHAQDIAATFTGGFKRSHSGFRHGHLSKVNNGSHYGFIEEGVILSTLQPELATVIIDKNNNLSMKTWETKDNKELLPNIQYARQNGVPIIDGIDSKTSIPIPGSYVNQWGKGNWSGSIDSKERALRAGLCLSNYKGKKYLIYGYFSTATPSAMARVFQAYQCEYAMHLDMNALEHTYLATYSFEHGEISVHNLIDGMKVLDRYHEGKVSPRFIGQSDNRDFFYLFHKN
ncbi:MAG: hypothetical protein R3B45_08410 [Bdellovibrionota bacterium]